MVALDTKLPGQDCLIHIGREGGKGYATEAVKEVLFYADLPLGRKRTVCLIAPENTASIRVAERCGYQKFGEATYKGERSLLFERLPHEGDSR